MPECECLICGARKRSQVVYLTIEPKDVRPGDWAEHRTFDLDPRRVARVDHKRGAVWLYLTGGEFGPLPIGNYTYDREV